MIQPLNFQQALQYILLFHFHKFILPKFYYPHISSLWNEFSQKYNIGTFSQKCSPILNDATRLTNFKLTKEPNLVISSDENGDIHLKNAADLEIFWRGFLSRNHHFAMGINVWFFNPIIDKTKISSSINLYQFFIKFLKIDRYWKQIYNLLASAVK